MLQIKIFTFNTFQENTYLLYSENKECVIFDPGCYEKNEEESLLLFIKENGLKPLKIINTHCHIDHVLGNKFLKDHFGIPLIIPELEDPVYKSVKTYSDLYGFNMYQEAQIDGFITENDKINIGDSELQILSAPGHSPGHLIFVSNEQKFIIGGDVLFQGSIGRTDLPGGNHEQLLESIKTKLFTLPNEFIVYPGHGASTNIGFEKMHNPFFNN